MIRFLFLFCVCLVLGGLLFQKIASGSGYVLISLGNTSLEMSFWMGIFLLTATVTILMLTIWLAGKVFHVTYTGTAKIARMSLFRGSDKANQRQTARGLIEFMEGNWKQSRKHLLGSAKNAEFPMINYLAAARATYELGNDEEALELLHRAETSSADSGLAVALTQARMLIANRKYEQCLANLQKAKKLSPHHPVVLDLLQQTYVHLKDWKSLKTLLPELKKHEVLTDKEYAALENTLYSDLLHQAGTKAHRQSRDAALSTLKSEWDGFPFDVRKQESMLEAYVQLLIETEHEPEAEAILRKEINREWRDRLLMLYGRVTGKDTKKQQVIAEGWLKERPGSAALLLTLGRLCLRNQRWVEAKEYLDSSLKLKSHPETYAELARLLAHLGDYKRSTECYQRGLSMTTDTLPPLPMPPLNAEQINAKDNFAAAKRAVAEIDKTTIQ